MDPAHHRHRLRQQFLGQPRQFFDGASIRTVAGEPDQIRSLLKQPLPKRFQRLFLQTEIENAYRVFRIRPARHNLQLQRFQMQESLLQAAGNLELRMRAHQQDVQRGWHVAILGKITNC